MAREKSKEKPKERPRAKEAQPEEAQGPRGRGVQTPQKRGCAFCAQGIKELDYKQVDLLRRFVTDRGKIQARRRSHLCAKHQRRLALAIKRARHLALLPFTAEHTRAS